MITTTNSFISDESIRNSMDVMVPKHARSAAFKVAEYFGIRPDEMKNTKRLQQLGVCYTKRLEELGVSFKEFEDIFGDVIDIVHYNTTNGNTGTEGSGKETNTHGNNEPEIEPGLPNTDGVPESPKRGRRKRSV